jgi:hypothetical protein
MKRILLGAVVIGLMASPMSIISAAEPTKAEMKAEKAIHPRIAKSIKELNETIAVLEKAPNDFGGHKAAAISACQEAVAQLKLALEYRAEKDTK